MFEGQECTFYSPGLTGIVDGALEAYDVKGWYQDNVIRPITYVAIIYTCFFLAYMCAAVWCTRGRRRDYR